VIKTRMRFQLLIVYCLTLGNWWFLISWFICWIRTFSQQQPNRFVMSSFCNFYFYLWNVSLSKVEVLWESHKTFTKSSFFFLNYWVASKIRGRFWKMLWPSQDIWTLCPQSWRSLPYFQAVSHSYWITNTTIEPKFFNNWTRKLDR
jgi:hypothetical protein